MTLHVLVPVIHYLTCGIDSATKTKKAFHSTYIWLLIDIAQVALWSAEALETTLYPSTEHKLTTGESAGLPQSVAP